MILCYKVLHISANILVSALVSIALVWSRNEEYRTILRYSRTRRPAVSRWQSVIRGKINMGRTVAVAVGVFFAMLAVVLLLLFPGVGDVLRWYSLA